MKNVFINPISFAYVMAYNEKEETKKMIQQACLHKLLYGDDYGVSDKPIRDFVINVWHYDTNHEERKQFKAAPYYTIEKMVAIHKIFEDIFAVANQDIDNRKLFQYAQMMRKELDVLVHKWLEDFRAGFICMSYVPENFNWRDHHYLCSEDYYEDYYERRVKDCTQPELMMCE